MKSTRQPPLKVFATRIGLDDVAVAASSQKAALAALGVHANLFASGAAGITKDADLVRRALAQPGEPVKRRIAFSQSNFAKPAGKAAAKSAKPSAKRYAAAEEKARVAAERAARQARIAAARDALKVFEREARAQLAELEDERHALETRETRVKTGLAARRKRLEAAVKDALDS
jgi:hypothetical protein